VSDKLIGVHPDLAKAVQAMQLAMLALGFELRVTDGLRTTEQQQALYAKGRTAPGSIVTKADGVRVRSNHQSGRAVDCCFVVGGQPSWAESHPWALYGAMARALGLRWGGDWQTPDRPHLELP
jgi:D-alanyl-D-alanine dipeptidase